MHTICLGEKKCIFLPAIVFVHYFAAAEAEAPDILEADQEVSKSS